MIITLTVIALLLQFVGVYALIIHVQRAQGGEGEAVSPPSNQRGRQAYYNAFAKSPDKSPGGSMAA